MTVWIHYYTFRDPVMGHGASTMSYLWFQKNYNHK